MAHLSPSLLGSFQATLDGQPVTGFKSDKVRALLAYLAVEAHRPHRREALAGLLWPDWPDQAARSNLRGALSNLRRAIDDRMAAPPFLLVVRETIQFNAASDCWLDVTTLTEQVTAEAAHAEALDPSTMDALEQAVDLFHGRFLEAFSVDSAPFEEWILLKQTEIDRQVLEALHRLTQAYERRGEFVSARDYAQRQLALEPWRESAHRDLMRVLALSGQRGVALAQYEICRRALAQELGVEPTAETAALYKSIRDGALDPPAAPDKVHNLPASLTPFVGREAYLTEIADRLQDPGCRLLSLVGPGGIGKTRLAVEAAREQLDRFEHGVFFVSLAPVGSVEAMVPTVAQALGFALAHMGN